MRSTGQTFCIIQFFKSGLNWCLLGIRLRLWIWGKNITQLKCTSHYNRTMGYMQWTQPVSSDIPLFWIKVMFATFLHCNGTIPLFSYFGRELLKPTGSWRLGVICISMTHVYLFYSLDFVAKFFPALTSGGLFRGASLSTWSVSIFLFFEHFFTFCHYKLSRLILHSPCFSYRVRPFLWGVLNLFILEWYLGSKIQVPVCSLPQWHF